MTKNQILAIQELNSRGFIPGIELSLRTKIIDVQATNYDYHGYKYAESENYYNSALALKLTNCMVEKPFWVILFKGAQYRDPDAQFVAAFENLPNLEDAIYAENGLNQNSKDIDGLETILNIVEKFDYLWFTEDEASDEDPLIWQDADALSDAVDDVLKFKNFIYSINKPKQDITVADLEQITDLLSEMKSIIGVIEDKECEECSQCKTILTIDDEAYEKHDGNILCDACATLCEGCGKYYTDNEGSVLDGCFTCKECADTDIKQNNIFPVACGITNNNRPNVAISDFEGGFSLWFYKDLSSKQEALEMLSSIFERGLTEADINSDFWLTMDELQNQK